jgi:hypothetical protein
MRERQCVKNGIPHGEGLRDPEFAAEKRFGGLRFQVFDRARVATASETG